MPAHTSPAHTSRTQGAPGIDVDDSSFPMGVVSHHGSPSDEQYQDYLLVLEDMYARREPFALVIDATEAERPSARQRKVMDAWRNANDDVIQTYNVGTSFVFSSPWMRMAVTAMRMLTPLPCPCDVFATRDEAKTWASQRLRQSEVPAPLSVA